MPQNVHNYENVNKRRNFDVFCKPKSHIFSLLGVKNVVLELCFVSKENTLF